MIYQGDCMAVSVAMWAGCYDAGWRDLIVPAAFAHPAKMSRALVARIFDELFASGAIGRGSLVVDPFGGIGTTAIEGASRGVQVVCCELETKFVRLAAENFALHARDWQAMGRPAPRIVNGDSRKLREHVGPVLAECVVSSPPYADGCARQGKDPYPNYLEGSTQSVSLVSYGDTPGQLGGMEAGTVDAVVSSPPYAEIASGSGGLNTKPAKDGQQGGRSAASPSQDTDSRYGESAGQLARMALGDVDAIVSSPPFTQGYAGGGGINRVGYRKDGVVDDKVGERTYQGTAADRVDGNLETMPLGAVADALVSSPPYEGSLAASTDGIDWQQAKRANNDHSGQQRPGASVAATYPATDGNVGNATGETFWSAALDIVRESYAILKPGGTAVWVVKHFVRDKAIVDFPGDWRKLCESVGFETVTEVHAMLVAEETKNDLFDGPTVKRRERKSFFRRLAEKKGSPRIDFETVYFMRKPEASA